METSGDTDSFQTSSQKTNEKELSLEELIEIHESLYFYKCIKRKGLFDKIHKKVQEEINQILENLPKDEDLTKKETIQEIQKLLSSLKWARAFNLANISGEILDIPGSIIIQLRIMSIFPAIASIINKHHLRKKVHSFEETLREKFPEISWKAKEINYREETLEFIDTLISIISLINLPIFGTAGFLLSLGEIFSALQYRKQLLDIQLELLQTVKKIHKEGAKELLQLKGEITENQ